MSTDLVELTKTTQEQFFGALGALQDTMLETYTKVATATEKFVPAELRMPVADLPVDPKTAIELSFGFATKLLDTQKAFVEKVLAVGPAVPAPAKAASK
jgi:hypothetical protein